MYVVYSNPLGIGISIKKYITILYIKFFWWSNGFDGSKFQSDEHEEGLTFALY